MTAKAILTAFMLLLVSDLARAAPPTVEIVAMAHPPVKAALAPLRAWLAGQGDKVKVVELDAESPAGAARLEAVGLRGHIPVLVLVDGHSRWTLSGGRVVSFHNFPAVEGAPPAVRGDWTDADVRAVVARRLK